MKTGDGKLEKRNDDMSKIEMMGAAMLATAAVFAETGCCDKKECGAKEQVVVSVGAAKLTRAQLDADVETYMRATGAPAQYRAQVEKGLAGQFLVENVLVQLAKEKGCKVDDAQLANRKAALLERALKSGDPAAPKTVDEIFSQNPFGAERALAQFVDSILIDNLVKSEVYSKDAHDYVPDAQAVVARIEAENAKAFTDEAAEARIKELKAALDAEPAETKAQKFAEFAKELSGCPSGANGGDLGWFGHGQMVPEFDEAAFKLAEGEISGPVKTTFGWHLVMKTGAKAAEGDAKEQVRASHILLKTGNKQPVPSLEEVTEAMQKMRNRKQTAEFINNAVRSANAIVDPAFREILPPEEEKSAGE